MEKKKSYKNSGRQPELDFIKGFTIIVMAFIHVTEYYSDGNNEVFIRGIEFLASPPGAPVFMALLGVGIVYSRHNSAGQLAKRGLLMFVLSYVYNIFVYAAPYFIYGMIFDEPDDIYYSTTEIFDADILQFAGLAFLFFALAKKLRLRPYHLIIVCFVLQAINTLLISYVHIENRMVAGILGCIWGTGEDSYFPFLSWIAFPVMGYIFAKFLINCRNKKQMYTKMFFSGMAMYVSGYLAAWRWDIDYGAFGKLYQDSYYHMDVCGNLIVCSFVIMWLGGGYFVYQIVPRFLRVQFKRWSQNITVMYVTQYVLIIYLQVFLIGEENLMNVPQVCLMSLMVFLVSDAVGIIIRLLKNR